MSYRFVVIELFVVGGPAYRRRPPRKGSESKIEEMRVLSRGGTGKRSSSLGLARGGSTGLQQRPVFHAFSRLDGEAWYP